MTLTCCLALFPALMSARVLSRYPPGAPRIHTITPTTTRIPTSPNAARIGGPFNPIVSRKIGRDRAICDLNLPRGDQVVVGVGLDLPFEAVVHVAVGEGD